MKKFFYSCLYFATTVVFFLTCMQIIKLNILPLKYLLLLIVSDLLLVTLSFIGINMKKKILRIIAICFTIFVFLINIIFCFYVSKINKHVVKNISSSYYKVKTSYYIVGKSSDSASAIKDIDSSSLITYYGYSRSIKNALKLTNNYKQKETDNVLQALDEVSKNDNYYFLVAKANYDYFFSSTNLLSKENYKIIDELLVEEKLKKNDVVKDSYNIYVNGLDFTGIMRDYNMIATINTKTHKILLTSIPRDYYIDVPKYNMKDTLMCLGSLDSEVSKDALENLFDIDIDYTISFNTNSLVDIVDLVGGVEFCSDYDFTTTHALVLDTYDDTKGKKLHVSKGCQTYNGIETLAIARERNAFPGRDRYRQRNCAQLIVKIGKKIMSLSSFTNYSELLKTFDGLYVTDMNENVIKSFIKTGIDNSNFEIINQSVDGSDGIGVGHLGTQESWIMNPDMSSVNNASEKIKDILHEK